MPDIASLSQYLNKRHMSEGLLFNLNHDLLNDPDSLRVILDAADIPINYCSADERFLFVNRAYANWYGLTPDKIIGKRLCDILGHEGVETIRPYFERALKGEQFSYETEVNLSIGYRYIQCRYTPMLESRGQVVGWVGIIYDMTDRFLLERSLQRNEVALTEAKERAEAANRAKSEFLANMSHELRTPLNAVVGLASLLQSPTLTPQRQKDLVQTLQFSAQHLLELINDLLDVSKLEAQSVQLEHIPFVLSTVLSEVIGLYQVKAKQKQIHLIADIDESAEHEFLGDPLRLRQIIMNLLSNAIKFTDRGTVMLVVRPHDTSQDAVTFDITLIDTGIGIPKDKIDAIFDSFTQADSSTTRKYGGTGLGLSISKSLVELMGGSVGVESEPGKGSSFTIRLTFERSSHTLKAEADPHAPSDTFLGAHVLLVEDYAPNVLVATNILKELGCTYTIVSNGHDAVEAVKHQGFDMVLMDIQMPQMDGMQATRIIRQWEETTCRLPVPIVGMTAYALLGDRERCLEAGMDYYIAKPYRPSELEAVLKRIRIRGARSRMEAT